MVGIDTFFKAQKSMIIAPAGYGKTHTIITALKAFQETKKVLVLTHTHAGVASIRDKAKKEGVSPSKYTLDTICSFALFITESFLLDKSRFSKPEDKDFFPFAVRTATKLLNAKPIKDVLACSFSHLIVDEYQDCTTLQHHFILMLSSIMNTHVLGDPLQGIFDFNDTLVDMESPQQMMGFIENKQTLDIPWRWKNNNEQLGLDLASIRSELCGITTSINISSYKGIIFYKSTGLNDIYTHNSPAYSFFCSYIYKNNPESLLVIVPNKHNVQPFANRFKRMFGIREMEAFDDKWYYELSELCDSIDRNNILSVIHDILLKLFPQNIVKEWINNRYSIIRKRTNYDRKFYNELRYLYSVEEKDEKLWPLRMIELFKNQYFRQCKLEKTNAILNAFRIAYSESISVCEGMKKDRDKARRLGRRVVGRYVGTTLLTKGLEFDTVFVMNPNEFSNKKHLYVALTRATQNLFVISTSNLIRFK